MIVVAVARESTETSTTHTGAAAAVAAHADSGPPPIPGTTATGSAPPLAKRYFRIGEVARIVGVEAHVLRYWEREFRQIRPEKSQRGQRVYSRADVVKLQSIRDLLYTQGFTIAGAKKRLSAPSEETAPPEARPFATASEVAGNGVARDGGPTSTEARPFATASEVAGNGVAFATASEFTGSGVASAASASPRAPRSLVAEAEDAVVSVRHAALLAAPAKAPPRISEGARRELLALRAELSALLTALES